MTGRLCPPFLFYLVLVEINGGQFVLALFFSSSTTAQWGK